MPAGVRIRVVRNIRDGYTLKFPAGTRRNVNFVLGGPDERFRLYDLLESYLVSGRDGRLELDLAGEGRLDPALMLADEFSSYADLLGYLLDRGYTEHLGGIAEDTNEAFVDIISKHRSYNCLGFLKAEGREVFTAGSMSRHDGVVAYYSLLAAIRKHYGAGLPLIVNGFGTYGSKFSPQLIMLISRMASQAVILTSRGNFESSAYNNLTGRQVGSMYCAAKNTTLGAAYEFYRGRPVRYDPERQDVVP